MEIIYISRIYIILLYIHKKFSIYIQDNMKNMIEILSNFFLGGVLSGAFTLIVQQYQNQALFLSGYLYTAPLMFPYILYLVSKDKSHEITHRFVRHCVFGLIFSVVFIISNYNILHHFTKNSLYLFIINTIIVLLSYFIYSCFLYKY